MRVLYTEYRHIACSPSCMHWFPYPTGPMGLLSLFWLTTFLLTFGVEVLLSRPRRPRVQRRHGPGPHALPGNSV